MAKRKHVRWAKPPELPMASLKRDPSKALYLVDYAADLTKCKDILKKYEERLAWQLIDNELNDNPYGAGLIKVLGEAVQQYRLHINYLELTSKK